MATRSDAIRSLTDDPAAYATPAQGADSSNAAIEDNGATEVKSPLDVFFEFITNIFAVKE